MTDCWPCFFICVCHCFYDVCFCYCHVSRVHFLLLFLLRCFFQFSWLQFILPICVDIQFFLIFLFFFCSESIRIYISINQLNNAYRISINQFYKKSLLVMHFLSNDSHLESYIPIQLSLIHSFLVKEHYFTINYILHAFPAKYQHQLTFLIQPNLNLQFNFFFVFK